MPNPTYTVAWVSGIKPIGYTLHVEAEPFRGLDGCTFTTASAAFAIQRAIRAYMKDNR